MRGEACFCGVGAADVSAELSQVRSREVRLPSVCVTMAAASYSCCIASVLSSGSGLAASSWAMSWSRAAAAVLCQAVAISPLGCGLSCGLKVLLPSASGPLAGSWAPALAPDLFSADSGLVLTLSVRRGSGAAPPSEGCGSGRAGAGGRQGRGERRGAGGRGGVVQRIAAGP